MAHKIGMVITNHDKYDRDDSESKLTQERIRNRKGIPTDQLYIATYTLNNGNQYKTTQVIVAKFINSIYGPGEVYVDLLSTDLYKVPVIYYKAVHPEDKNRGFIYNLIPINIQEEYISQNQAEKILSNYLNSSNPSNKQKPKSLSKIKDFFKKPTQL